MLNYKSLKLFIEWSIYFLDQAYLFINLYFEPLLINIFNQFLANLLADYLIFNVISCYFIIL